MVNAYDILTERGFIAQCTHGDELRDLMSRRKLTFYMGYDPTVDSLTAGHLLTLMAHAHLTRAGHKLITLMGTGTGMIGDPSDRSDMRKVQTPETVAHNINCFKQQFSRFVDYEKDAIMEDNGWLLELKWIEFMRDYGVHFNVNKMLAAECYKNRLQDGLTAFEMSYMLMQAYDFLELYRRYGCRLQLGGSEQWGNIIAGIELVRKTEGAQVYGLTNILLTAADGGKMGKSMGNAVWLSAEKTAPYDFYQHWRNTADADVVKFLKLFTFLELDEIEKMAAWQGAELNKAKEILAYEVTKIVHGADEAEKAREAARAAFGGGGNMENVPTTELPASELPGCKKIMDMLMRCGLFSSRSEARRNIEQGGIRVGGEKITDIEHTIENSAFDDGTVLIQKGKKVYHRVKLV
jgi:tyrosyl-tRNA synthetase